MAFADNLRLLPSAAHLSSLELFDTMGQKVATIENKPGQAGSLAVYAALTAKHGGINAYAAKEGLELYAEHTADAQAFPGKHPNIDRLIEVIATGAGYSAKLLGHEGQTTQV